MNEHPVGTGPYRVIEHAPGKYVRLERNPDYFADGPKKGRALGKIELRFIPDRQTQIAEVIAGGLDLVSDVARDQAEQLRGIASLRILSGGSDAYELLRINTLPATPSAPLRDLRVRQAIMHAIDREAIVANAGFACGVSPERFWMHRCGCAALSLRSTEVTAAARPGRLSRWVRA
jgi:peptide/nickel transport system substrate-binding protein